MSDPHRSHPGAPAGVPTGGDHPPGPAPAGTGPMPGPGVAPPAGLGPVGAPQPGFVPPPAAVGAPDPRQLARSVVGYLHGLGRRASGRPQPRFTVLVAVAGVLLMLGGLLATATVAEVPDALLIVAFLGLTAGGFALVWSFHDGPLATAGATASTLGLPLLLSVTLGADGGNGNLIGLLSLAGWAAAYLVGPGRGHLVYLGSVLLAVAVVVVGSAGASGSTDDLSVGALWATVLVSAAYLGVGFVLERQLLRGLATAFIGIGNTLVAIVCLAVISISGTATLDDVTSSSSSFGDSGSALSGTETAGSSPAALLLPGLVLMVGGILLIRFGVAARRRASAWVGATALLTGTFGFLFGILGTNGTALALAILMVGGGMVGAAALLSDPLGEADELAGAPSFTERGLVDALRVGVPELAATVRSRAATAGVTAPPQAAGGWAPVPGAQGAPGPGWWLATDQHWYPPLPAAPPPGPTAPPSIATAATAAGGPRAASGSQPTSMPGSVPPPAAGPTRTAPHIGPAPHRTPPGHGTPPVGPTR